MIPFLTFSAIPTQNAFAPSQPQFSARRHWSLTEFLSQPSGPQFLRRGVRSGERIFYDPLVDKERYGHSLEEDTVSLMDRGNRTVRRRGSVARMYRRPWLNEQPATPTFEEQFANMNVRDDSPRPDSPDSLEIPARNRESRSHRASPSNAFRNPDSGQYQSRRRHSHPPRSSRRQHRQPRAASQPPGNRVYEWYRDHFPVPRETLRRRFQFSPTIFPADPIRGTEGNNPDRIHISPRTGRVAFGPRIRLELEQFANQAFRTIDNFQARTRSREAPPDGAGIIYLNPPASQIRYGEEDYQLSSGAIAMQPSRSNEHLLFLKPNGVIETQVRLDPLPRYTFAYV